MKLYFFKYLPVEGEIKVGDLVRHTSTGHTDNVVEIKDGFIKTSIGGFVKDNQFTKGKLFLCSRGIQVGDEVYIKSRNFQLPTYLVTETDFNPRWSYANVIKGAFKIIAEVSPEAIWVKEGDEFDEDEVKITKFSEIRREMTPDLPEVRIKIKGPCGHFH